MTFIAHLQPSRQDVPEYVEYLEKIEALVAVINHRHGTTDWMPIDLRLRDDFEEAVALYKHFDLLLVNAMWDGMNLVAKEGPLINKRNGMIMLSENTGAHEELGDCAISVNPFDVQEQADAIHTALTASPEERAHRMEHLQDIIAQRSPEAGSTTSSPTSRPSALLRHCRDGCRAKAELNYDAGQSRISVRIWVQTGGRRSAMACSRGRQCEVVEQVGRVIESAIRGDVR